MSKKSHVTVGASKEVAQVLRQLAEEGWTVEQTKRNHFRLTHPLAARPVFCAGTSGSNRIGAYIRTAANRAIRQAAT